MLYFYCCEKCNLFLGFLCSEQFIKLKGDISNVEDLIISVFLFTLKNCHSEKANFFIGIYFSSVTINHHKISSLSAFTILNVFNETPFGWLCFLSYYPFLAVLFCYHNQNSLANHVKDNTCSIYFSSLLENLLFQ